MIGWKTISIKTASRNNNSLIRTWRDKTTAGVSQSPVKRLVAFFVVFNWDSEPAHISDFEFQNEFVITYTINCIWILTLKLFHAFHFPFWSSTFKPLFLSFVHDCAQFSLHQLLTISKFIIFRHHFPIILYFQLLHIFKRFSGTWWSHRAFFYCFIIIVPRETYTFLL